MSEVTSENCTHDCSTCGANCSSRQPESFLKALNPYSKVRKVIAVVSGKGGVGKSLVTSMLAAEMQRRGHRCAVLDADITGPSIPKSFGIHEHATGTEEFLIPVTTHSGIQIMSINLILENETEPVVWRGPVIAGAVTQFWTDVVWSDVDYMFVDMPPGTGDVPLTVFQSLPIDGVIIVTTPQDLVSMIVAKAVNMASMMNVPVLGMVENMSYFVCPDCGKKHEIFGESRAQAVADSFGIPQVAKIPIDPVITTMVDAGEVEHVSGEFVSDLVDSLENNLPAREEA
ncbi:MAG: Mrp/NBP35 family ATP-binding protein [Oscillospiraceae bacterium]|nr:Mrp/NBP35 family ATP-binding protein [Oscillospiraceae bacterium]